VGAKLFECQEYILTGFWRNIPDNVLEIRQFGRQMAFVAPTFYPQDFTEGVFVCSLQIEVREASGISNKRRNVDEDIGWSNPGYVDRVYFP